MGEAKIEEYQLMELLVERIYKAVESEKMELAERLTHIRDHFVRQDFPEDFPELG